LEIGGHTTKRVTVNEALREYIRRRKQKGVLKHFGKIPFDTDYNYKKARAR